jgi:phosphoglycolate phosphatase-like HAD superfamily hydrolase
VGSPIQLSHHPVVAGGVFSLLVCMKQKKMKIIFLDFDGTLCDPSSFIGLTMRKILDKYDYKFSREEIKAQGGKKMKDRLSALGVAKRHISVIVKKFFNTAIIDMDKDKIKLCCDVRPLYSLHKKGYRFVVISNNESIFIGRALELLNIDDVISEYYGSDTFTHKSQKMKDIIATNDLDLKETYSVGDRFSDVIIANSLGIVSVAMYNQYAISSVKELLSENPDFVVSDFKGLQDIVLKK